MQILYILDFFYPSKWWVEKVFENLIFSNKSDSIIVLTSRFDKKLSKIEKLNNVTIFRIWKNRFWFTILASLWGLKLLKNVNLIHCSTYNAAFVAKFFSFFTKAKVICTSHEILGKNWMFFKWRFKGFFYKKLEDMIYSFNFYYVFVTNHVKNVALTNYKVRNYSVIYNWLENIKLENITKQDLWFKHTDKILVFAGRPGWPKWLNFVLKNFKDIKKIIPNAKLLLLLLEKKSKAKIKKLLKYISSNDIKVLYEIPHEKVYNYLNLADIWIVPSRSEWFGFTALEFSTLWKNSVFSYIGWIPEINYGDCHFFIPDNQDQFLNCFKEISNWKKNNYWYNKQLTVDKMLKNYHLLYNKLTTNE